MNNPSAASDELYFVTITVINWIAVFIRREYKDFLVDQLEHCQKNKGLKIYAYVIMSSHLHLVCSSDENLKLSDILRDFKTYTSKEMIKKIQNNSGESRREWMLELFFSAGKSNSLNKKYQFWQNGNMPVVLPLQYPNMIDQKINYIHENPVREGIVLESEDYYYSSACIQSPIKVEEI